LFGLNLISNDTYEQEKIKKIK